MNDAIKDYRSVNNPYVIWMTNSDGTIWITNAVPELFATNTYITNIVSYESLGEFPHPPKPSFLMQPPNRIDCMIVTLLLLIMLWRTSRKP